MNDVNRHKGIINLNRGDVQSKAIISPAGIAPSLYAGECRYGGGELYIIDRVNGEKAVDARVFDARGNGEGGLVNTITGDHENRVTDYTTLVVFNSHDLLTRDVCQTLTTGKDDGHSVPIVGVYCLQGNGIDRADTAGCNGKGWREDTCYTLNTIDRPAVVYGICSYESNAMKSDNPHSGIYEAKTSKTLDLNGGNPACNQGGMAVVALRSY